MRNFSVRRVLKTDAKDIAKYGLYRIITSSQKDLAAISAVSETSSDLSELYNLAEVKRTDKSCDVKSFDKLKAIELMIEIARLEREESDSGESFFKSFMQSCEKLGDKSIQSEEVDKS